MKFATFILFTWIGFITTILSASDVEILAEVNSSQLMRGETGRYSIRILNAGSLPQVETPSVSGLEFSRTPQTSQMQQIINGAVTREIQLNWYFRGREVGTYTIPGQRISLNGKTFSINPIEIKIVETDTASDSNYFLRVILSDETIYLGQAVEAELKLFVKSDLEYVPSNLNRESDAFLHQLADGQAERSQVLIEGVRYQVSTWKIGLTPVKTGKQKLVFEMMGELVDRTRRDPFDSIFNFGSRTQSEPVAIYSPDLEIDVKEIPNQSRPEDYFGAIGDFDISAKMSSRELEVGEPFTLNLIISGYGNLDRIDAPSLAIDETSWRIYPPKKNLQASDKFQFEGTVSFEYIIIPQLDSVESFPELSVSAFNPTIGDFQRTVIEPEPIQIAPSSKQTIPSGISENNSASPKPTDRFYANLPDFGTPQSLRTPLYRSPSFWIGQSCAAIAFMGLFFFVGHRQRLHQDESYANKMFQSKAVRKHFDQAISCATSKDVSGFFANGSKALKVKIARLESKRATADSLVISELMEILNQHSVDPSLSQSIQHFFEKADAIHFASASLNEDQMANEVDQLKELLKNLPN